MKGWRSTVGAEEALAAASAAQAAADAAAATAATAQAGADASLKKTQNLADVSSTAAARNSIGANQVVCETRFGSLVGASAEVRYLNWPFSGVGGFAVRLVATLEGPLATGDATLSVTINGVTPTPAALTLTQAGSAAGSSFSMLFTAGNAIPAGAAVGLTVGGSNTATVGAAVTLTAIF